MVLSIIEDDGIFLTMRKQEGPSREELLKLIDEREGKK
jgi:hypothetical protein